MMATKIKIKRSYTAGAVPVISGANPDLEPNEVCINYPDKILYVRTPSDQLLSIPLGGSGGGGGAGEDTLLRGLFVPAAPTNLTATAGNAQATVSWTAPTVLAQTPITDYVVQYSSNGGSTWTTFVEPTITVATQPANQTASSGAATFSVTATVSPSGTATYQWEKSDDGGATFAAVSGATSATLSLTSLTNASDNNDRYRVVVSAVGATAVTSSAATLTVNDPPNAPTSLTATAGNAQIALSWTAPSAPGSSAITGYTVEYTPSGGSAQTVSTGSTGTSYTLTGLTNGTSYTVRVAAVSAAGAGAYSASVSGTPNNLSVPGVPTNASLRNTTVGCNEVYVSWQPPASDGGSPIIGYRVIGAAQYWGACGAALYPSVTNCGHDVTYSAATREVMIEPPGNSLIRVAIFAINSVGSSAELVVSNYTHRNGYCD